MTPVRSRNDHRSKNEAEQVKMKWQERRPSQEWQL